MNRKSHHSLLLFSLGAFTLLLLSLAFLLFPFLKSILTVPHYVAAQELQLSRDFHASIFLNDALDSHIFSDLLIGKIQSSHETIQAAIYSIDSQEIRDELYAAANRGIQVSLVLDYRKHSQHAQLFLDPPENFRIIEVNTDSSYLSQYMHHKFVVFDGEMEDSTVLTGAWNWTILQEMLDPTFVLETQDPEVVSVYVEEFWRLAEGMNGTKKFGDDAYKPFARKLLYNDCFVEIWFAPGITKNSIKQRILDLIETSRKEIRIMVWRFTDGDIARALRRQAEKGIRITLIADDYNVHLRDSAFRTFDHLFDHENIDIITDAKRDISLSQGQVSSDLNSFLHHHTMIVDSELVLFGTNNWSERGAFQNDENMIVTDNDLIVQEFEKSFFYHFEALTSN